MKTTKKRESPVRKPSRTISERTTLFLYVRAGGMCEFDGCPKYLLEHDPTESPGNFGERAHIYAFNENGPRGRAQGRPSEDQINEIENLVLLCPECHHLVDEVAPEQYPVEKLRRFKSDHEARIHSLTTISKNRDTIPLVIKGLVAGRPVDISDEEMQAAAAPNYIKRRQKIEIDLTRIPDAPDQVFWTSACDAIDVEVHQLHRMQTRVGEALRVSVFGLGPIPLLVYLGAKLSDKIDVDLYQRHRSPEFWGWKTGPGEASYVTRRLADSGADAPVALLVNLSGRNAAKTVVSTMDVDSTVYEITLDGSDPSPLFLNTTGDLDRFTAEYVRSLAMIREAHPAATAIHLFPAVPAPVAITLGRARLPKVDAPLVVYDRDHRAGGFARTLEIA